MIWFSPHIIEKVTTVLSEFPVVKYLDYMIMVPYTTGWSLNTSLQIMAFFLQEYEQFFERENSFDESLM